MPMLPLGWRLTFLLDSQERFQNTARPRVYMFTAHADGPAMAVETMLYIVDLGAMAWVLLETRPTKQLEVKLAGIERALRELSTGGPQPSPTEPRSAQMGRQRPSLAGDE
ncbi:hypothetical protein [Streptomyces sioyaensis]|uniref:hypothetical protein n=1 Tax=Streptomyces sioyaensis TaxID=67364 RepID=UPI00378F7CAF